MNLYHIVILLGVVVSLILIVMTYMKVDKNTDNYSDVKSAPSPSGHVAWPSSGGYGSQQDCEASFDQSPYGQFYCGGSGMMDYVGLDNCYNVPVAYTKNDCKNPYLAGSGYLCGDPQGNLPQCQEMGRTCKTGMSGLPLNATGICP